MLNNKKMKDWILFLVFFCATRCLHGMPSTLKDIPEEYMNVSEIIRYYGYPCEVHTVTTSDGYILTLHRIPSKDHRGNSVSGGFPVYLQHGFLDSASTWIINLPAQSLGFMLADAGYDVWLGNSRGNFYSSQHVNISTDDARFWDFSFDEMAKYDVPACIDYITAITNHPQLYYVGHSQGTTVGFIAFEDERVAAKIKTFFALAPVATVAHVKGAAKLLADVSPEIQAILDALGFHDLLPSDWIIDFLAEKVCGSSHEAEIMCGNLVFLITGFDKSNLNDTRIPVYLTHFPSGTSVKNLIHFLQMVKSGKFCMYDYGDGNMNKYNQSYPPLYNVTSVKTPVAIFYGENDWLADVKDVEANILPYVQNQVVVQYYESWNHLDFVWGVDANTLLYNVILKMMDNGRLSSRTRLSF